MPAIWTMMTQIMATLHPLRYELQIRFGFDSRIVHHGRMTQIAVNSAIINTVRLLQPARFDSLPFRKLGCPSCHSKWFF
jgi:hypothetical protein